MGLSETGGITGRLAGAATTAEALAAAWDAFDAVAAAAAATADPASDWYAAFMFAAAEAAEARDSAGMAPSMPAGAGHPAGRSPGPSAGELGEFCRALPGHLAAAAGQAALAGDREALARAAAAAERIRVLLAGCGA